MADYKKEWMDKAKIDYFSPFTSLWLACNSWYQSHYSEINGMDRTFIDKIKTDNTGRNHIYTKFDRLLLINDKNGIYFRTNLEMLHYSLSRANLKPDKIDYCSFENAVTDYDNKSNTENLIMNPKINKDGTVNASDISSVIKLDKIYITSDKPKFFSGLIEIIYQVRNMLIHGKLNPGKDEHDVVKYCYFILWDLMQ